MQKACGGVGDVKKADAKIQGIVDNVILLKLTSYLKKILFLLYIYQLRAQVSQKCGKNFQKLTAINYKSQIVAGTNYFIKVYIVLILYQVKIF